MATLVLGSVVADIRGSIGEQTYGRNAAGIFVRARTSPSQPESAERDARQAGITHMSQYWSGSLTESQRSQWRQYAATHSLPDRFGRPRHVSGLCFFIRNNTQRWRQRSDVTYLTPPINAPIWPPGFSFTADASTNKLRIEPPPDNYPDPVTSMWLFAYAGRVINVGRNFYRSPWRYADYNKFISPHWWKDPWLISYPWTLTPGDRVFCRLVAAHDDGNTSRANQASTVIVP